ncbi:hypothetical protein [Novosphingobium humi]|uniref:Thioredoxin domain-containing protein n=1 Tax=Novosphingobium humi TaxID=2282397 RepID=A0ABY7TYG3_9SPHN|nr:hypothetical protein [Novosphingobium humi]WCT78318.1 hypothetical protein PQ457_04915 [Novosphingobium humi]
MRKLSIALYGAFLAASSLAAPSLAAPSLAAQAPSGAGQVILLGARWCAPCMAEWRDLAALVAAASPDQVVLAWVDRPMPPPPALNGQVAVMPHAQALELAQRLGGEGFGLPMAAYAPVGRRPCAPWRGPLRPKDMESLRQLCAR